jgi:hypothetical protein
MKANNNIENIKYIIDKWTKYNTELKNKNYYFDTN